MSCHGFGCRLHLRALLNCTSRLVFPQLSALYDLDICEDISLTPGAELVLCGSHSGSGSRLNEQDKNMAACSISGHYFRPRLCSSRPSTHFFIPRLLFCLFRLSRCFPAQLSVSGFANKRPLELMGLFFFRFSFVSLVLVTR